MLLIVGQIGRAHGIRGEVSVYPRTDEPEARFSAGATVVVDPAVPGLPATLTVQAARPHQGRLIITFAEIPDRNAAEAARGALLRVDADSVAAPSDPEEFLDHQLVGLDVVTVGGEQVGTVSAIDHAPASDLLVVRLADGRSALVPFVSAIVPEVDLPGGRVVIDPPGGLLDL